MGILGIDNRTENWRTVCVLSPLVERHGARSALANHLVGPAGQCGDNVEFELFWKGMRDYVHAERQGEGAARPEHPGGTEAYATRFLSLYRDCFPSLRQEVERFRTFQRLEPHNYLAKGEYKKELYNNLLNTEIDIVLQTDTHLCIGEAKSSQNLDAKSKYVLVHQLIRQYVMARIIVELTGSKKEIVPFVVGDSRERMKKSEQVKFMINWERLRDSNILSWAQLSDILGRQGPALSHPLILPLK